MYMYMVISTQFKLSFYEGFCTGLVLKRRHKIKLEMMFLVYMSFFQNYICYQKEP